MPNDLPVTGMRAELENADGFARDAKRVQDAYAQLAEAEARLAKTSPAALAAFQEWGKTFVEDVGSLEAYSDAMADLADDFDAAGGQMTGAWEQMAQLMGLGVIQQAAGAMDRFGGQMIGFAKETALAAARIEELGLVLGNLSEQSGVSAAAMEEQVEAIRAQGIQADVAYRLVTQFVQANLDLSQASQLARVAQDAAVISMEDSSQALSGILHGVMTLQPEMLRYRGLIVDLEGEYRKWAEESGKAYSDLTGNEKQQIALNAAIAAGAKITGTYESAMESASKQLRSMPRYVADLKVEMGEALLPVFSGVIFAAKDLMKAVEGLPDPMKAGASSAIALSGGLLKAGSSSIGAASQIAQIAVGLKALNVSMAAVTGVAIPALVAGLALVAGVGIYSYITALEEAHRQEAAAVADAAGSYDNYLDRLAETEGDIPPLTKELWELAQAANAAAEGFDALSLIKARESLAGALAEVQALMDTFGGLNAGMGEGPISDAFEGMTKSMTDAQLAVAATYNEMVVLFREMGFGTDRAIELANAMNDLAQAEQQRRGQAENEADFESDRWRRLNDLLNEAIREQDAYFDQQKQRGLEYAEGLERRAEGERSYVQITKQAYEEIIESGGEVAESVVKIGDSYYQIVPAIVAFRNAQEQAAAVVDAVAERTAAQIVEAQRRADEQIRQADENLKEQQADLWEDYRDTVAGIQQDIVQVGVDLADDVIQAERDAAQEREQVHRDMAADIEAAERDLAQSIEDLQRDTARSLADLQRDTQQALQDAEREHAQAVEELNRDTARDIEDIVVDFNRTMIDLARDRQESILAAEQRFNDDMAAAARDLARAMEEGRAQHAQNLENIDADYREAVSKANDRFAAQQRAQAENLAAEIADIRAKYDVQKAQEPTVDERREDLMARIAMLQAMEGRTDDEARRRQLGERRAELQAELDALMQTEINAARARSAAKTAAARAEWAAERENARREKEQRKKEEAERYAEEQAERQRQYDELVAALREALTAEREEIDKDFQEKAGREEEEANRRLSDLAADYERRLEDLRNALQLEREEIASDAERRRAEIQRAADERHADLLAAHERERAEIERRTAEALAQVDVRLAEEKARLAQAAAERTAQLQAQLAEERANYAERQADLVNANLERKAEIDAALDAEVASMQQKAIEATLAYIDGLKGLGPDAQAELERMAIENLGPALDGWIDTITTRAAAAYQAWMDNFVTPVENSIDPGSPSKWMAGLMDSMVMAWDEGRVGMDAAMRGTVADLKAFQADAATVAAPSLPVLPRGGGQAATVTNSRTVNVTANYRHQSERSLREDMAMYEMMMR